jgi:hypothetical protein
MEVPRDQVWRVGSGISVSAGDRMVVLSQLARKHPQWTILELHPGDGLYDVRALGQSRGDKWSSLFPTTSMGRHTSIMILIGREVSGRTPAFKVIHMRWFGHLKGG